jgi:hypothetical protein
MRHCGHHLCRRGHIHRRIAAAERRRERLAQKEEILMDPTFVPSTPNPQTVTLVASVIRSVLALLSGAGIVAGSATNIPDSTLTLYASIVVGLGTAAWSLYQKFRAAQMAHAGSVQSSKSLNPMGVSGTPVKAV